MKKKYNANNLYVGRIMYISNENDGPFCNETKLKYIFEAKNIGQPFYEEIFTGMKIRRETTTRHAGYEAKEFYTPYIIELESFINYFSEEIDKKINYQSMLLRMNEINGAEKKKEKHGPTKVKH